MSRTRTLWVRQPYLAQILAGRKTVEVRVGYDNIRRLQPGDWLRLNGEQWVSIRRIDHYDSFEELLVQEDPAAIAPDLPPDRLLNAIRQIYPAEKEALGVVALEVALRRYKAVLFDMGYTLIHFEPTQETIVQEALRAAGLERSVDEIKAAVQVVWGEYYQNAASLTFPATPEYDHETQNELERSLLAQLGLAGNKESQQTYTDSIESRFSQPGVLRPYPEVVEVLTELKAQDYLLGIVSNWSWNLRERVVQVELDDFFQLVWASAYAGCNKPHPDIFRQALAQMGISHEHALYVGDSYQHDVIGARNAHLDVVLLDRDGTAESPDCPVIHDLWGVFDLLV